MQERKPLLENAQANEPAKFKADILPSGKLALSTEEQGSLNNRLFDAAWKGDNAKLRKCLAAGADIAAKDGVERTALHLAARYGRNQTCALVINEYTKAGGNVRELMTAIDNVVGTALREAANEGRTETVKFLKSIEKLSEAMGDETFDSFTKSFSECIAA
jgi:ankyrin repeat protein